MADSETLAALAAQVDDLRGTVAKLQVTVTRWSAKLESEGLGGMLVLGTEVKRLADKLTRALDSNRLAPPPAPYWLGLTQEEATAQRAELRGWVEGFLRPHYPGYAARLRPCWPNHGEAVWELSTLMTEWLRVYSDEDNRDLAGALWFHERWLPGVLTRLDQAIKCDVTGCQLTRRRLDV